MSIFDFIFTISELNCTRISNGLSVESLKGFSAIQLPGAIILHDFGNFQLRI